jgi:hypothetical protein
MKPNNRLSLIFYIPPASKIRYFVPGEKASKQDLPPVTILSLGICLLTPLVSSNTSYSVLPDSLMYLLLQAGIPGSQLMLALEPEAASIFCKHIPSERMVIGGKSCLERTDNTMAKRKSTKGQTTIYKTYT